MVISIKKVVGAEAAAAEKVVVAAAATAALEAALPVLASAPAPPW